MQYFFGKCYIFGSECYVFQWQTLHFFVLEQFLTSWSYDQKQSHIKNIICEPIAVAEWLACLTDMREVSSPTCTETHMWGSDWPLCCPPRGQQVLHQRWISGIT